MAVFKCKMCGGSLEVTEGMTVCECEYCGTKQTLPKTDNEQALNMFNRANHFRQQCEFDKAAEIYERMTAQRDDAELYWSIVLCRYGIEYVDDPLTKKKIPTCHRTQYKSILEDADYLEALSHADSVQKEVYKQEAEYIDKVQKGILEISNKEKPFDVFICYKETDDMGRRTPDSVLAQDLYYGLVKEGFKVFFSRITLESKLGTEYEPYIFAALNSAKVMVVVGTKPEYFNAVWVRNEWSRYLMLMQEDRSRTLIPAYKDMDPYDLPDALSMFQAQDMSKLGFMQDLIRGIGKIANDQPVKSVSAPAEASKPTNSNIENLLKRGALALEDGDWDAANGFYEQVLNENVEESRAYFGMVLAYYNVSTEDELYNGYYDYTQNNYFKKAQRFANSDMKEKLDSFIKANDKRVEVLKEYGQKLEKQYEDLFSQITDLEQQRENYTPPKYEFEDRISELEENSTSSVPPDNDLEEQYSEIKEKMAKLNQKKGLFQSKSKKNQMQQFQRDLEAIHRQMTKRAVQRKKENNDRIIEIEKLKRDREFFHEKSKLEFLNQFNNRLNIKIAEIKEIDDGLRDNYNLMIKLAPKMKPEIDDKIIRLDDVKNKYRY